MLKLVSTKKKVLSVELPDGETIKFTLRIFTLEETAVNEEKRHELEEQLAKKEIKLDEYMMSIMELSVEPFNRDRIKGLEIDHITQINQELTKLQKSKAPDEKKSQ